MSGARITICRSKCAVLVVGLAVSVAWCCQLESEDDMPWVEKVCCKKPPKNWVERDWERIARKTPGFPGPTTADAMRDDALGEYIKSRISIFQMECLHARLQKVMDRLNDRSIECHCVTNLCSIVKTAEDGEVQRLRGPQTLSSGAVLSGIGWSFVEPNKGTDGGADDRGLQLNDPLHMWLSHLPTPETVSSFILDGWRVYVNVVDHNTNGYDRNRPQKILKGMSAVEFAREAAKALGPSQ